MPQACAISTCEYASLVACRCCNQSLCREHFVEHDNLLRSKLNNLNEQINQLQDQLKSFDVNEVAGDLLEKLNKWRLDSYKVIDQFYEEKCLEFNKYINEILNKQEKETNELRLKIVKMINVQQTTNNNIKLLISTIQTLKQQMEEIEHMSIQIDICPLVIKDNLLNIEISTAHQSDLLKLPPPYQTFNRTPLYSDAIASNSQYLLLHQNSTLYLIDEDLFLIQEKKWLNDWIRDMCWSSVLDSFIVITLNHVYLIDESTLMIEHVKTIEGRFWQSCTCSVTSLYLSKDTWDSSVDEYSLTSSIKFIKHWKRTETIDRKQRIDSIHYSNGTLALTINDKSKKEIFIELRSTTTFNQLWLCRLDIEYSERKMQCCLLRNDAWMVADWGTSSLFYITKTGKVEKTIEYEDEVHRVNLFGKNKLVISTDDRIHFHKI